MGVLTNEPPRPPCVVEQETQTPGLEISGPSSDSRTDWCHLDSGGQTPVTDPPMDPPLSRSLWPWTKPRTLTLTTGCSSQRVPVLTSQARVCRLPLRKVAPSCSHPPTPAAAFFLPPPPSGPPSDPQEVTLMVRCHLVRPLFLV